MDDKSKRSSPIFLVTVLLVAAAALYIAVYLLISLSRISYPFDLEWMEGGMVDHVRRVLAGQPLYVAPGIDFVTYIYPPLYFYLSAAVSLFLGAGLFSLRLVSFFASLLSFALIARIVWKETADEVASLMAVGFFAGAFSISGGWYDLARIDMLSILITLTGIYAVRFGQSPILAAVIFTLAALTKQTAIAIALAAAIYYAITHWRHAVTFAVTFIVLLLASTLLFDVASNGWYRYYVFELPGQHPWVWHMLVDFWLVDLVRVLPAGIVCACFLLFSMRRNIDQFWFYGLMLGVLVGSSWFSRLHEGGFLNGLIPALAGISLVFGIAVATCRRNSTQMSALALILAGLQFIMLIYNPATYLITADDRSAVAHFVETIATNDGEVLVVHHGAVTQQAGRQEIFAHRMAIEDVMRGSNNEAQTMLQNSIDRALEQQRFAAIVFDGSRDNFILVDPYFHLLETYYVGRGPVFTDEYDDAMWPATGLQIRPYYVFVPKP